MRRSECWKHGPNLYPINCYMKEMSLFLLKVKISTTTTTNVYIYLTGSITVYCMLLCINPSMYSYSLILTFLILLKFFFNILVTIAEAFPNLVQ